MIDKPLPLATIDGRILVTSDPRREKSVNILVKFRILFRTELAFLSHVLTSFVHFIYDLP